MSIFKAYDIRGIYPTELNEELAYKIGKAAAKFFNTDTFVVGSDVRISRDAIFNNFTKGLMAMGVNVVNIGVVTTPLVYWTVSNKGYKTGAMITASHNPKEYNGIKFCKEGAFPVAAEEIQEIRKYAEADLPESDKKGIMTDLNIIDEYRLFIEAQAYLPKRKRVVIDTGNAVCGKIIPLVYKNLNIEIIPLFFDPDPTFPNHAPNPLEPENTEALIKKVLETGADMGAAFDGDGDRVFLVDDKGEVIGGDFVTLLVALAMIEDGLENKTFLIDCRCSWIVKETLEKLGSRVIASRVGHSFIKRAMRKENVVLAGELSGHYYYQSNSYAESSDLTLMNILKQLCKKDIPLSEIMEPYKIYFQSGEINSDVEDKDGKMKELQEIYSTGKISHIDGVTIEFDDWWMNVRPSNTEPLLRLNLEARNKTLMEQKRDEVLAIIRK